MHLLAGHVQLHVQSHDLLLHEPEVFADFRYMMNIQYSGRRLVDQVNGDWYVQNQTIFKAGLWIKHCPAGLERASGRR